MLKSSIAAIALSSITILSAAPAFAGTQDDVRTCRAALAEDGRLNMDNYRLDFEGKKGNRVRTLTLEAISSDDAPNYEVKCTIERSAVTKLELTELN
ncbi:MAG: hypothetical protein MRY59_11490 [Aquisalinus sp.]|nr:hypothetical protein [Aquisalinus sp.]